uniref:CSON005901 protein n=1 Tax=Culicoides sonorensis TaxID=179676 RepID=A0A336LAS2_CULSO
MCEIEVYNLFLSVHINGKQNVVLYFMTSIKHKKNKENRNHIKVLVKFNCKSLSISLKLTIKYFEYH